jgi:hypothetical protein
MEASYQEDLAIHLRECVTKLSGLEVSFVECCCLEEPKMSMKAFAEQHRLKPREMAELRRSVRLRLQEEFAAKGVRRVGDIL